MKDYTASEFAKVMIKAIESGQQDCFIVINENHFMRLLMNGQIVPNNGSFVKVSTGKKCWFGFGE